MAPKSTIIYQLHQLQPTNYKLQKGLQKGNKNDSYKRYFYDIVFTVTEDLIQIH